MAASSRQDELYASASLGEEEDVEEDLAESQKREKIAHRESHLVFWGRLLVLLVLVASALAVVLLVYFSMTHQETREFEERFESDSTKIYEAVGKTFDQILGSTDAFISQILTHAHHSPNASWPYVTIPSFALHASKLLKLAKAFQVNMAVFVQQSEREEWLSYSHDHLAWIDDFLDMQATDEDWQKPTNFSLEIPPNIQNFLQQNLTEPTDYGVGYLLGWQQYPVVEDPSTNTINEDMMAIPTYASAVREATTNQRTVLTGGATTVVEDKDKDDPFRQAVQAAGIQYAASHIPEGDDPKEPMSGVLYPMVDLIDSVRVDTTQDNPVVGILTFFFQWRKLLDGILPTGSNGLVVVFSDDCAAAFSFRMDGPDVTYIGPGDRHDPRYDYLGKARTLPEMMRSTKQSAEGSSYTGLPLTEAYCVRSVSIYPSQDMEDIYVTNDPLAFTMAALAIFVFTSLVFVAYDCLVARRQRIVMERALASGAIVSSLFPEKVKQQLYEERAQQRRKEKEHASKAKYQSGPSKRVSLYFEDMEAALQSAKPIAELFDETTIYFADLAGFTAWSAQRTPVEVFELLEALYGAFDPVAKRRKVFKVETIGDCYVAVTGIPEPQKHHAAIMVRFAKDCMVEMHNITQDLAASLGEDTAGLEMRVGMHSGSTTAGVLRGEKGRFQLFGDTVNTASRMESNGVKGRIHVSQATADAIIASGKGHWLTEREDKIVAKGKGEMTTYFVEVAPGSTANTLNSSNASLDYNES